MPPKPYDDEWPLEVLFITIKNIIKNKIKDYWNNKKNLTIFIKITSSPIFPLDYSFRRLYFLNIIAKRESLTPINDDTQGTTDKEEKEKDYVLLPPNKCFD